MKMSNVDADVKKYIEDRDKAIEKCWITSSVSPMTKFIKKYEGYYLPDFLKEWKECSQKVKWLTVCKMTINNSNIKNTEIKEWALSFIERMKRKCQK